jgi:hypothetical protein
LFDVSGLGFLTKEEKRGICFSFGPELHCREYSGQAIFFGQFFFYLFEVFFFRFMVNANLITARVLALGNAMIFIP